MDKKVSESKVAAFREEFPWLKWVLRSCFGREFAIEDICVERADEKLLLRRPRSAASYATKQLPAVVRRMSYEEGLEYKDYLARFHTPEYIYLLNANGEDVAQVGEKVEERVTRLFKRKVTNFEEIENDTVDDTLARLGDKAKHVHFIVSVSPVYDDDGQVLGFSVVIYKSPKGMSYPEWLARQRNDAAKELRDKLAEIDTVA